MEENDIDNAVAVVLASKELRKKAGVDYRVKFELENQDKRPVHVRKKLEILWKAGMLKLTDENS